MRHLLGNLLHGRVFGVVLSRFRRSRRGCRRWWHAHSRRRPDRRSPWVRARGGRLHRRHNQLRCTLGIEAAETTDRPDADEPPATTAASANTSRANVARASEPGRSGLPILTSIKRRILPASPQAIAPRRHHAIRTATHPIRIATHPHQGEHTDLASPRIKHRSTSQPRATDGTHPRRRRRRTRGGRRYLTDELGATSPSPRMGDRSR